MQPKTVWKRAGSKSMNKFQLSLQLQKTIHILPTAKKYLTETR